MTDVANVWIWLGFSAFLIFALSIDSVLLNKSYGRPHQSIRAALSWTVVWVASALVFNGLLWFYLYETSTLAVANVKSAQFFAGYLIEKSLSLDNLFVFYVIFRQFRIPVAYQQRVFTYGIWGAVILRLIFILCGSWLVNRFHWTLYVMGVFLLFTGAKIFFTDEKEKDLAETMVLKLLKRLFRVTHELHEEHFFVRKNLLLYATPLFIALIFIEISDIVFAFDSVPAIFAITTDPFIVWSSNIFAILGLRAMYFILANMVSRFSLLKYGIALILIFVGSKMVVEPWLSISVTVSLCVIIGIIVLFSLLSVMQSKKQGT